MAVGSPAARTVADGTTTVVHDIFVRAPRTCCPEIRF